MEPKKQNIKGNPFSRKEVISEYYKTAKELHMHQDNIRFSMLKFYFLSIFGLLISFGRLELNDLIEGVMFIIVFFLGIITLLVLMSEHSYFLRYKKWMRILENEIASPSQIDLLELNYTNNEELKKIRRGFDLTFTLITALIISTNSAILYMGLSKIGVDQIIEIIAIIIWLILSIAFYVTWATK
ncbi:MAG: hypothetical protein H6556_32780 [Lewinellaceae bacterium]|nr:hypothetical protein [Lewinellaceae bacterium]